MVFHADRDHAYRNTGRKAVSLVMVVLQPDADFVEWRAVATAAS